MGQTNRVHQLLLTGILQTFMAVVGYGQSGQSHSAFFKAALEAKTPAEAALYTQKACALAIRQRQYATASRYYFRITAVFYEQQQYLTGIRHAQKGIGVARQYGLDSDTLSFQYYGLLASMYSRLAMNDSALYWYGQTEQLLDTKPVLNRLIPGYVEAYFYNKSVYYLRLGDQEQAAAYIRRSVELVEKTSDKRSAALSYLQLANYYFGVHQFQQAIIHYRKARSRFEPGSIDACWGDALLGNCFRAAGRPAEGLKWLKISKRRYASALDKFPDRRDVNFEVESSYYLGKCEQSAGFDDAAINAYQTCIAVHQWAYGSRGELIAAGWNGQAAIALKKGQVVKALQLVQQAILAATVVFTETDAQQNPEPDDIKAGKILYEALRLKGTIWSGLYYTKGRPDALEQAVQTYRVSLRVAQRIRRSFTRLESTYFFNEKIKPGVEDALEAIYEWQNQSGTVQRSAAVFDVLQAYQSMGMADALHEKTVKHETIPAKLLQEEQDLRQQLATAETQLLDQPMHPDRPQRLSRISAIKRHLFLFEEALARRFPRYHALKYADRHLALGELQPALDGYTAYVSYFAGERFLYGFLATHSRVVLFRRVMAPGFTQAVTGLRQELAHDPGMFEYEGRPAANRLYDYLIRPIDPYLIPIRRLIIERDGILNNIPFDVLERAGQPDDYLCKRMALSYSYAAGLTFSNTGPVAPVPLRPAGFAPYSEDSLWRGKNHAALRLLRKSAAEIRAAGGNVYVNAQATKAQFFRAAHEATLLHLATHATADDAHPEASAISFYPDTADSLLRAVEIVNLPLDSVRLVVLSACEGNTGVLWQAEGVLSLARAFRLAGCPTILTTTWSAHNETTSELVRLFYLRLHQGLPADVALQQARLDYIGGQAFQKWGHPYHWANLTLIGNPDVSFPATEFTLGWLAGLLTVLLAGGLFVYFRRSFVPQTRQPDRPANLPAVE